MTDEKAEIRIMRYVHLDGKRYATRMHDDNKPNEVKVVFTWQDNEYFDFGYYLEIKLEVLRHCYLRLTGAIYHEDGSRVSRLAMFSDNWGTLAGQFENLVREFIGEEERIQECGNCGSNAQVYKDGKSYSYVTCPGCKMQGPNVVERENAIRQWNMMMEALSK